MDEQQRVATFIAENDLEAPPAFRLLDLVSEVGELAKDAAESTGYGETPSDISVEPDELGDALFSLLALANTVEIDASDALDEAIEKYSHRMQSRDSPSSGQ